MSEENEKYDEFLKEGYVYNKGIYPFMNLEAMKEFRINIGEGTGSVWNIDEIKIKDYSFERYVVKVGLSPDNEFLGIIEINVNEDFRSLQEKLRSQKYHNLEELTSED